MFEIMLAFAIWLEWQVRPLQRAYHWAQRRAGLRK